MSTERLLEYCNYSELSILTGSVVVSMVRSDLVGEVKMLAKLANSLSKRLIH